MEYCLGGADGSATMWTADPNVDVDGDGALDAVGLDFDGDGLLDDAMADLDGDGLAEHLVGDYAVQPAYFTDDGTGTWAVAADGARQLRWFGLDGVEHTGGSEVDVDGDGQGGDQLIDTDGDELADRTLSGNSAYVDTDGDGRWDVRLVDSDGDGKADAAAQLP